MAYSVTSLLLGALCAIAGTGLHALCNACGIQSAANDVVTDAREILYTAAANENHGVLLQVVADAGDIGGTLETVGKTDTGDLTKS